jgi:hypothetical protein
MSTSKLGKIMIESGRTLNDFAAMQDSGDGQIFTITGGTVFSGRGGSEPAVRASGVVTGRNMVAVSTVTDEVDVASFTAYSKGLLKSVSPATATIGRPGTAGYALVSSVTMASDGSIAVVAGTAATGASGVFSETRGGNAGPPLIPVYDVEIAQVRTTVSTAGTFTADEVFQVIGTHVEHSAYPVFEVDGVGQGSNAAVSAQVNGHVKFADVLPSIHTGGIPKAVYLKYYAPIFTEQRGSDFVPAEKSHSVSSQQIYNETIASSSESLNAGGFTAFLGDGITDPIVAEKNQVLTVKYLSNRNLAPYSLTQGTIGLGRTYPVANQNQAAVTISAERETAEFSS